MIAANRLTLLGVGSYLFSQMMAIGFAAGACVPLRAQTNPYSEALLGRVRAAARAAPESRARSIHFLTFAEAEARRSGAVAGLDTAHVIIAFPVFQIRFAHKWIMVDAGFDRALWDKFQGNWPVTYWQDRYDRVLVALRDADRIVLTHEHWDHAAGVERGPQVTQVAAKTFLTPAQLKTLIDPPDSLHFVRLDSASASTYRTAEYDDLVYSVAPGVVLIKAPGHTPGAQLIYVQLDSGRELLLVGDLVWLKEGLETGRQRPKATSQDLKEDRQAIQQQIDWVRSLLRHNRITAVPCHDNRVLKSLVQNGALQEDVDITMR